MYGGLNVRKYQEYDMNFYGLITLYPTLATKKGENEQTSNQITCRNVSI